MLILLHLWLWGTMKYCYNFLTINLYFWKSDTWEGNAIIYYEVFHIILFFVLQLYVLFRQRCCTQRDSCSQQYIDQLCTTLYATAVYYSIWTCCWLHSMEQLFTTLHGVDVHYNIWNSKFTTVYWAAVNYINYSIWSSFFLQQYIEQLFTTLYNYGAH